MLHVQSVNIIGPAAARQPFMAWFYLSVFVSGLLNIFFMPFLDSINANGITLSRFGADAHNVCQDTIWDNCRTTIGDVRSHRTHTLSTTYTAPSSACSVTHHPAFVHMFRIENKCLLSLQKTFLGVVAKFQADTLTPTWPLCACFPCLELWRGFSGGSHVFEASKLSLISVSVFPSNSACFNIDLNATPAVTLHHLGGCF